MNKGLNHTVHKGSLMDRLVLTPSPSFPRLDTSPSTTHCHDRSPLWGGWVPLETSTSMGSLKRTQSGFTDPDTWDIPDGVLPRSGTFSMDGHRIR